MLGIFSSERSWEQGKHGGETAEFLPSAALFTFWIHLWLPARKHLLPAQRPREALPSTQQAAMSKQLSSVSSKGDRHFLPVPPLWCTLVCPDTLTFPPESSEKENAPCMSVPDGLVFFCKCSHRERPLLLSDLSGYFFSVFIPFSSGKIM